MLVVTNYVLPIARYEAKAQPRLCFNVDVDIKLDFWLPIIYVISSAKLQMRYVTSNSYKAYIEYILLALISVKIIH